MPYKEWHLVKNHGLIMITPFNIDVAKACYVNVDELEGLGVGEVAERYILPKLLGTYSERVSVSRFLKFMAKWGRYIYQNSSFYGCLLFELGLQRISRGALLHEGVDLVKLLPKSYQKYTFAYDEYRIFTEECWEFFENNLCVMFSMNDPKCREHCRKIVFGIMEHIDINGETDMLWNNKVAKHTPRELRALVKPYATERCSENERWNYLARVANNSAYSWVVNEAPFESMPVQRLAEDMAKRWYFVSDFYRDNFKKIDWSKVREKLNLDDYQYYTGVSKKVLKLFGLYNMLTFAAIKAEIRG